MACGLIIGSASYEEEFLEGTKKIENVAAQSNLILALVLVVSFIAAVVVWLFTSRGIAGPIVEIAGVVRKIAMESIG